MQESHSTSGFVKDLLEEMVQHRERVVRQIAGSPAGATSALLDAFQAPEPIPASSFRKRLAKTVARTSWAKEIYEVLTPWGRQDRRAREEDIQRQHDLRIAKENARHEASRSAARALRPSREEISFLLQSDLKIVHKMVGANYFSLESPVSMEVMGISQDQGPKASVGPGGSHPHVQMVGDRFGDYLDRFPDGDELITHAQKWAAGELPDDHVERVYLRWHTLFHELGHCEYRRRQDPFSPSEVRMDQALQEKLNKWVFGELGMAPRGAGLVLEESYVDAYAAMVLLEATDHDPRAVKVLEDFAEKRQKIRQAAELDFLTTSAHKPATGEFKHVHSTDFALRRVLESAQEWKGSSPEELKVLAHRYASDGMMDLMHPGRLLELDGGPHLCAGNAIRKAILPEKYTSAPYQHMVLRMAESHSRGADVGGWLNQVPDSHPAKPLLRQSWDQLLPSLENLLDRPIPPDETSANGPVTVREGMEKVRQENFYAIKAVYDLVENSPLPVNDSGHPLNQGLRQAYKKERAQIVQGLESLGQPVVSMQARIPSLQAPGSVAQWRSGRKDSAPSRNPSPAVPPRTLAI